MGVGILHQEAFWCSGLLRAPNVPSLAGLPVLQWTQAPSTQAWECSFGVAMDTAGNLYTVGGSDGTVFGVPSSSGQHYIAKYTPNGNLAWENQWSASGRAFGVAVDRAGNVLMADGELDKNFRRLGCFSGKRACSLSAIASPWTPQAIPTSVALATPDT